MLLRKCISTYLQPQFFQQSALSEAMLLRKYISALPQSIAEAPLLCNAASFRFCENDSFVKHVLLKHINSLNRKIMEPFRFFFVEFSRNGIPLESLAERCGKSHFESRQLHIFSFALPQYIFECPEYCGSDYCCMCPRL
jgi:hypothetical protein